MRRRGRRRATPKTSLNAKTDLLLIEAASSGGGKWGRPAVLRLVEFPAGMNYTTILNPNAKQINFEFVDARHKGPRSHFGRAKAYFMRSMKTHGRENKRGSNRVTVFA